MEPPLHVFSAEEVGSVLNAAEGNEPPALPMVFCCDKCGYRCVARFVLEVHQRRVHPQRIKYQCRYCEYSSNYRHHITEHDRIHTGERPFVCKVCQKSFGWLRSLTRHLLVHTKENPHKCPYCGRFFADASNLRRHRKQRRTPCIARRPFQCLLCSREFSHVKDLETHSLTHREERPQARTHASVQATPDACPGADVRDWGTNQPPPSSKGAPRNEHS